MTTLFSGSSFAAAHKNNNEGNLGGQRYTRADSLRLKEEAGKDGRGEKKGRGRERGEDNAETTEVARASRQQSQMKTLF